MVSDDRTQRRESGNPPGRAEAEGITVSELVAKAMERKFALTPEQEDQIIEAAEQADRPQAALRLQRGFISWSTK